MSLINNMLRDLEARRKQDVRPPASEVPIAVNSQGSNRHVWLYASGFLLLGVLTWLGLKYVPETAPSLFKTSNNTLQALKLPPGNEPMQAVPVAETDAAVTGPTVTRPPVDLIPVADTAPASMGQKPGAELLNLGVSEADTKAQLILSFTQVPEYRLLQNGAGGAHLVVSFNQTQLGENFNVPELKGGPLQRISLLPQQKTLQLLVDLDEHARVTSFQLVEQSEREYQLVIDIDVVMPTVEQKEKQQQIVAATKPDPLPTHPVESAEPKVNKSKNPVRHDRQAYQTGLEQLKLGDIAQAEGLFVQALVMNPQLLEARLQLIDLLLEQNQLSRAENQLRQGLVIAPGNVYLRKLYARFLLNAQRHAEAIDLLQARPVPAVAQDLEYHALLAALFQETSQFSAAADLYGKLLQVRPEQAVWWVGLGISMDQLGNYDQARNAYERALALPGLRPDLQNYIQSRLQVL